MSEINDNPSEPRPVRLAVWITIGVVFAVLVSLWQGFAAVVNQPPEAVPPVDSSVVEAPGLPDVQP